jgi:RHS repeat-associated protein
VTRYTYNVASELVEIAYQGGAATLGNLTYAYNSAGRRSGMGGTFAQVNLPPSLASATYNANNQLTSWAGSTRTYDANGNLTNDGTKTYTWNGRNELTALSGGTSASFSYDAFGRRTTRSISGIGTNYLYDGANIVQELSGLTPTANLMTAGTDEVLMRTDVSGSVYYLNEKLGSTIALLDENATIQSAYSYEPFGQTSSSGTVSSNSQQFTGRENDGGLYYYRARYYDPAVSRFVSEDPAEFGGGDANLYAYVGNDPVNSIDPFGLTKIFDFGQGWTGRLDITPTRNQAGFEIHVQEGGIDQGIISGQQGWVGRHGFPDNVRPSEIPPEVLDSVHEANLGRLIKAQKVPANSTIGSYLNAGRVYSVLPIANIILDELVAAKMKGRKPEEKERDCHHARMPEAPEYVLTNFGPVPSWMAGCSSGPGA